MWCTVYGDAILRKEFIFNAAEDGAFDCFVCQCSISIEDEEVARCSQMMGIQRENANIANRNGIGIDMWKNSWALRVVR